jgi:hypothetical protein
VNISPVVNTVTCFEVSRHRNVCRARLAADSHYRGNESTITLQQWQSVMYLRSTRGHYNRPYTGANRIEQREFKRQDGTVRSSSRFQGRVQRQVEYQLREGSSDWSSGAVGQPSRLVGPGRRVGPVGPEELKELSVLNRS